MSINKENKMTEAMFESIYLFESIITILLKAICILALSKYIIFQRQDYKRQ